MSLLISRQTSLSVQTFKTLSKCYFASSSKGNIVGDLEVEEVPAYEIEPKYSDDELDRIRNKSRLNPEHRRILYNQKPYDQSMEWYHDTVWYSKKMIGTYGLETAGVDPGICWPTKEEIADKKEYERLAYPKTIQELLKEFEEKKKEEALAIQKREEEIDKVIVNLDKWKAALDAKVAKKEAELLAAKERKERLLEEIREKFGFYIDPRDERFKEMLEAKEKEDKKKKKEEKKKKKQDRMLTFLAQAEEQMKAKTEMEAKKVEDKAKKVEEKSEKESGENVDKKKD